MSWGLQRKPLKTNNQNDRSDLFWSAIPSFQILLHYETSMWAEIDLKVHSFTQHDIMGTQVWINKIFEGTILNISLPISFFNLWFWHSKDWSH